MKSTTETTHKGDVIFGLAQSKRVICETVGSENWTVRIWRVESERNEAAYELELSCEQRGEFDAGPCVVSPADVLALPKLVQVICASLVNDGWLKPELKDDLACLGHVLDGVIGGDEQESKEQE